jgi:hypothetical protein
MRVFISWSGEHSLVIAGALRDWLPLTLQTIEPWMSNADIDPGRRWTQSLAEQLQNTDVGLICVTPENLSNAWLLFEAGAIAKTAERARVIPICIDITKADLPAPLAMFQAIALDKDGWHQLIHTLATEDPECKLTDQQVDKNFEKLWQPTKSAVEEGLEKLSVDTSASSEQRMSDREILDELLVLARASHEPTRSEILGVLKKWELDLRRSAAQAHEAWEKYDAPTGIAADRLEERADTLAQTQELISSIYEYAP